MNIKSFYVQIICVFAMIFNCSTDKFYIGKYSGKIPCADCPGIETELQLNSDFTYQLKFTYLERLVRYEEKGEWKSVQNNKRKIIELKEKRSGHKSNLLVIDKNTLELLDGEGERIGNGLNFRLTREGHFD